MALQVSRGVAPLDRDGVCLVKTRPAPEPLVVRRQSEIEDLCLACREEGRFGFDTEFVMEDRFEAEVCLVQIANRNTVALIDPLAGLNLDAIWNMVCDDRIETLVHAGQEDLGLAVQHTGRPPRRVFDLQVAAGLVGLDYPISLQRLVQSLLHVRLHKSKTLTNWRRRPLTEAQVRYAAEDVTHLLELHTKLQTKLQRLERAHWAEEEFQRIEDPACYRPVPEDRLQRLKGAGSLNGQQLAIAGRLLAWRDRTAQRINQPARILLKDHLLIEIAKHAIGEVAELRELRGLNLSERNARAVCQEVQEAMALPNSEWPTPKPREVETPREAALMALATAVTRSYCLDHDIAYGMVATQKAIKSLVRFSAGGQTEEQLDLRLLRGWRRETVGTMLHEVLTGRMLIHVEPATNGKALHVVPVEEKNRTGLPGAGFPADPAP